MKYVIGLDEVGRGSLAGPVTVAAVALPKIKLKKLKDSKKLSPEQREIWAKWIKNNLDYAVASVSPEKIDKLNITKAANLAAFKAYKKLTRSNARYFSSKVLLDGGLYINGKNDAKTIIKGDEKFNCIKLASIIAKVTRDNFMKKLHKKYPLYGFNEHKGYGTKRHLVAIVTRGPSVAHRLTFIKKYHRIKI